MDLMNPQILRVLISATGILLVSAFTAFWKNRRFTTTARGSGYAGGLGSRGTMKLGSDASSRTGLKNRNLARSVSLGGTAEMIAPTVLPIGGIQSSVDEWVGKAEPLIVVNDSVDLKEPAPAVTSLEAESAAAPVQEVPATQPVEEISSSAAPAADEACVSESPVEEATLVEQSNPFFQLTEYAADMSSLIETDAAVAEQVPSLFSLGDFGARAESIDAQHSVRVEQTDSPFASGENMKHPSLAVLEAEVPETEVQPTLLEEVPEIEAQLPLSAPPVKEEATIPDDLSFYGLSEQPFGVTPDPAYLYPSAVHQEALEALSHGIRNLRGFMALVAEPGLGKTTVLNKLMDELRDSSRTIFFFQTQCNSREFFRYLLTELGVECGEMDLVAMHKALNEILFQEMLEGRRFVLIVDEAQNLSESALETIRLLSDFETTHAKLIQIVLAGQPQLVDTLMSPKLSQLRQRIAVLTSLKPLDAVETAHYIDHRLRAAGSCGEMIFTPEAIEYVAEQSQGIPRTINNICFNGMMQGFAEGRRTISVEMIKQVMAKSDLEALAPRAPQQPEAVVSEPETVAVNSSQLFRSILSALASEAEQTAETGQPEKPKQSVAMVGRLTELVCNRQRGKNSEYRIMVSFERASSNEILVADRHYCCTFYVGEEQAKNLRVGQTIQIEIG